MVRISDTSDVWARRLAPAAVLLLLIAMPQFTDSGRWVLLCDGGPAPHEGTARGLQTSGLAWDGQRLWSVGDQRSTFPGHLFAIDPATARLTGPPIRLVAEREEIEQQLAAWGRPDAEGIEVLSAHEQRFVVLLEANATAALVVRVDESRPAAVVEAIWEFQFPETDTPAPFRDDKNFRLEGIAIDSTASRGYVGYERDKAGQPRLYQFDLDPVPRSGVGRVPLAPLPFDGWDQLRGKPTARLNVNGLDFCRTPTGKRRLFVLCRDRELLFAIDLDSGTLAGQFALDLRAPDGEPIEWPSPEGVAVDARTGRVFVVSDPDSTDNNWRLRSTPAATGLFADYVPLLFEVKLPAELIR